MKVLHVIPSISPLRGCPSEVVMSMVVALSEQGADASILATIDHASSVNLTLPIGCLFEMECVPILAFNRLGPPDRSLSVFEVSSILKYWKARNVHNYDLPHARVLFSWLSTTALFQALAASILYMLLTINHLSSCPSQGSRRIFFLCRLIERRILCQAVTFHSTSDDECQQ
jgi:hypothetical protein